MSKTHDGPLDGIQKHTDSTEQLCMEPSLYPREGNKTSNPTASRERSDLADAPNSPYWTPLGPLAYVED